MNIMLRGYKTKSTYTDLTPTEKAEAFKIISHASDNDIELIINVGTDLIESLTCIELAKLYNNCYAIVGIHPNDATHTWKSEFEKIKSYVKNHTDHKIIGIGECGIDRHYEDYNLIRQQDAFKAQIELALEYNLALSIHSRDAAEETYKIIDEYAKEDNFRGIMHCYSYGENYAAEAVKFKLALGIGGTLTYPKNENLRTIVKNTDLSNIVLETDAPFLPPQKMRGQKNFPANIKIIAQYIADLKETNYESIAKQTTKNVKRIFQPSNLIGPFNCEAQHSR